jgi:hypothetical protein
VHLPTEWVANRPFDPAPIGKNPDVMYILRTQHVRLPLSLPALDFRAIRFSISLGEVAGILIPLTLFYLTISGRDNPALLPSR